ncbi:hypothetical protein B0A49_04734 [Cryomyces minteri]|uniref:LrgB-like protein n=1 Tax=Cryomyces minteri TaxID=331657 RepID=A0A4U0X262_9PEZI|nr:hypothetical protein B0A49_04734 [Cryomyces minteri]
MADDRMQGVLRDAADAAALVVRLSWQRMLSAWLYTPAGILLILAACFGVNALIGLSAVSFPAGVACMIMLFVTLIACEAVFGDRKTRKVVALLDIPVLPVFYSFFAAKSPAHHSTQCGFALRYINIFFCPSFVLLPLSPAISGVEVGKIIAVFIVGYGVMLAFTAYFVRGLQIVLGTHKRAMTERAEEMGDEDDDIPLTQVRHASDASEAASMEPSSRRESAPLLLEELRAPLRAQDPDRITGTGGPPAAASNTEALPSPTLLRQNPLPLTRPQRWATYINARADILTYSGIFLLAGLPTYYGAGYAMPAQLALNVLAYFFALSLPPRWRKYLHPVLVSSALTILGIWALALCRRDSLFDGLHAYSTKTRYLQLWGAVTKPAPTGTTSATPPQRRPPGAGDLFSSVLDVSIVALALPMFQYRHELRRHFLPIIIPNVAISVASLFAYPALCAALGISPPRALSFASRSLTLALATPATANLGGDLNLVAVLCIMSGIMGVLVGPWALDVLKIPEDDYITRGVTLGSNSSAVATALLLASDPRAAAFSSLSMSLFGTVTVALTSVPPLVRLVAGLVALP